ncbi:MAG TPA: A24 family peptidase C-terminal domain-containing protein [Nitrosopumilus sp.]|nr:A24 family peptidase C-terminal domain-containing protein [Nitrosopumilus sp.]
MAEFFLDFQMAGVILALVMLILGSIIDIWKREIHDLYWIVFGGAGIVLALLNPNIISQLLSIGFALIIAPFVIIVWRIGLFGGADAFALIALAVVAPMASLNDNMISPFTTLSNAALLFIIPFLFNLTRNAVSQIRGNNIFEGFDEPISKKIVASFMGYKSKNPKFAFSIERTEKGKKKLNLAIHHAEDQEFCSTPNTWITPGIPYLLLITGGFIIQLIYGDIILSQFLGSV